MKKKPAKKTTRGPATKPPRTATKKPAAKPRQRLVRPLQPMPANVRRALTEEGLMAAYRARPPYQQNDYLGWIARAKLGTTKAKRLAILLKELAAGDAYMNMAWSPRRR
jgi:uncharacterized protein YdeI (YjbR/CyaY-like superfamily)